MPGIWSATWGPVGVRGPCCYWGLTNQGYLWCHLGRGDFWDELLPRALSGSMALLQIGPVLMMSMAHVTTGSHKNHVCWNLRSVLSWPNSSLTWDTWACPLLDTPAGELDHPSWESSASKSEPYPSSQVWESWPRWNGPRRAVFAFYLKGSVPAAHSDRVSYHPAPHPGPWVGSP